MILSLSTCYSRCQVGISDLTGCLEPSESIQSDSKEFVSILFRNTWYLWFESSIFLLGVVLFWSLSPGFLVRYCPSGRWSQATLSNHHLGFFSVCLGIWHLPTFWCSIYGSSKSIFACSHCWGNGYFSRMLWMLLGIQGGYTCKGS